jgi:uncharacterized C2H2 Zn-finger protein
MGEGGMSRSGKAVEQVYRCDSCGKVYRSRHVYMAHLRVFHPDRWVKKIGDCYYIADAEIVLACRFCGRRYLTPEGLTKHLMLKHPERYLEYAGRGEA